MKALSISTLLLLLALTAAPAQSQSFEIDLMPQVGYGGRVPNQVADRGSMSVGAQVHLLFRVSQLQLMLNPVFDYYLIDADASGLEANVNLKLGLGSVETVLNPWVGIGGKLARVNGNDAQANLVESTDFGLNLVAGSAFGAGRIRPFAEVWYTIGDINLYLEENFGDPGANSIGFHGGLSFRISD